MANAPTPAGKLPLSDSEMAQVSGHIGKWEGRIEHPYFDSEGNLTIGAGFNLEGKTPEETKQNFMKLPLEMPEGQDGARPATSDEKAAQYDAVMAHKPKTPKEAAKTTAADYEKKEGVAIKIPQAEIDRQLEARINTRAQKISQEIGAENWDRLSPGAKQTAIDVTYVSSDGTLKDWPELKKALENNDTQKISDESLWYVNKDLGTRAKERILENMEANLGSKEAAERTYREQTGNDPEPGADASEPKDEISGGAGKDSLVAREKPAEDKKSPEDKDVRNMLARVQDDAPLFPSLNGVENLLFKAPGQLTRDEADAIGWIYTGMDPSDPMRSVLARHRTRFFDHTYGTGPVPFDATGRPIDTGPLQPVPQKPAPAKDADGEPLYKTVISAAGDIAEAAKGGGLYAALKAAQSGLNIYNRITRADVKKDDRGRSRGGVFNEKTQRGTPPYVPERLKTDGIFGPKTHWALKARAAQSGAKGVRNAFAAGGVREAAESVRRRENKRPKLDKPQTKALQSALNAFKSPGIGDLKEDGLFGPKTASAFAETAKRKDPDDLAERFGRSLSPMKSFIN